MNPDALVIAQSRDVERAAGKMRGLARNRLTNLIVADGRQAASWSSNTGKSGFSIAS